MNEIHQPRVRNSFSNVIDAYKKYRRDYPEKTYDLIHEFCPDVSAKVLDLGCGTGIATNHLALYYDTVVGTDREESMVEAAREGAVANATFIATSSEKLPFEDSSFDLVTVASAYHWFDYDRAGKEIYRVLKPNGKLCVFWKNGNGKSKNYLPSFAYENLKKFITDIPSANKEKLSDAIFLRVGFIKVDDEEFDFEDIYSKEEILGYIQSHSTFNLLDEAQKIEYMKLNEASVDQHLTGNRYVFDSRMAIFFVEK